MTRPWHHRRLRVRPGGRRTSGAARLRAHFLVSKGWVWADAEAEVCGYCADPATRSGRAAWALKMEADAIAWADGWAAAARRWA